MFALKLTGDRVVCVCGSDVLHRRAIARRRGFPLRVVVGAWRKVVAVEERTRYNTADAFILVVESNPDLLETYERALRPAAGTDDPYPPTIPLVWDLGRAGPGRRGLWLRVGAASWLGRRWRLGLLFVASIRPRQGSPTDIEAAGLQILQEPGRRSEARSDWLVDGGHYSSRFVKG